MVTPRLRQSIDDAALALLNQIDRDLHSRTQGCADRRFWAWKLVDFPDATLQRMVQPLASAVTNAPGSLPVPDAAVVDAVRRALLYLATIQHADGSFDQAYPHEHSVAGTAFILDSAIAAMSVVQSRCDDDSRRLILQTFERAAGFLCRQDETHGAIGNHVAGSILALVRAEHLLQRAEDGRRADVLLDMLLASQTDEGWFPEYGGCDPGYMSLCVYYLAQVQRLRPRPALASALERAVVFLSHFVHPDGTFGGVYGSRRTAVYYPGGIALLAETHPLAARMTRHMLAAAEARRLVGPGHPDVGNAVPVLANYQLALDAVARMVPSDTVRLPFEAADRADFPRAGLYIRASPSLWAIVGAANGGTVAVWSRATGERLHDDGGWVAEAGERRWTTQVTTDEPSVRLDGERVTVTAPFRAMSQRVPGVLPFVGLRLASWALQWPAIGERVKALMVRALMTSGSEVSARTERTVTVGTDVVDVRDTLDG
ncbi:MAG: prenyltransferase/squalene oxidase repeat-containing protein, partial [Vicinamibacterales bacterium]